MSHLHMSHPSAWPSPPALAPNLSSQGSVQHNLHQTQALSDTGVQPPIHHLYAALGLITACPSGQNRVLLSGGGGGRWLHFCISEEGPSMALPYQQPACKVWKDPLSWQAASQLAMRTSAVCGLPIPLFFPGSASVPP